MKLSLCARSAGSSPAWKNLGPAFAAACLAILVWAPPAAHALPIPHQLWECESREAETCGTWTFDGSDGTGEWSTGEAANLVVQQFDPGWIVIRREDSSGTLPGLLGNYVGKLNGDRIEGTVTWTWSGHWTRQVQGTWYATFKPPVPAKPEPQPQPQLRQRGPEAPPPPARAGEKTAPAPAPDASAGEPASLHVAGDRPATDLDALVKRADELYDKRDYAAALPIYRQAAAEGRAHALMRVGFCFDLGFGVEPDPAKALRWYEKAVEAGDLEVMAYLGGLYEDGSGVARDEARAMALFRRSADGGEPAGMNKIGLAYTEGRGVQKNPAEAVRWFLKAANLGYSWAMINLGKAYDAGAGVPMNEPEALQWFRKAAELGNAEAMTVLGEVYAHGQMSAARDLTVAASWYKKAAALGDDTARQLLARLGRPIFDLNGEWEGHYLFQGLPEVIQIVQDGDWITATRLRTLDLSPTNMAFFRGRRVGDSRKGDIEIAQYSALGMLFFALKGDGSPAAIGPPSAWAPETLFIEDPDTIHVGRRSMFQRISVPRPDDVYCDPGNPLHVNPDYAFVRGKIAAVMKSYTTAACWYHIGIVQNSARSRSGMGDLLRYGLGVGKSSKMAHDWFDKAAASGDPYGALSIADMYDKGELAPDPEQSSFWHTTAREMKARQEKLITAQKRQAEKDQAELRLLAGVTGVAAQVLVNDLASDPECDVRMRRDDGFPIDDTVSPTRQSNRDRLLATGQIYCGSPIDLSPLIDFH